MKRIASLNYYTDTLSFSKHAIQRIDSRSIVLSDEDIISLENAIKKAQNKGARNTLVIIGDNAYIVNVVGKKVVTVVDKDSLKENVFTNIDSAVIQ